MLRKFKIAVAFLLAIFFTGYIASLIGDRLSPIEFRGGHAVQKNVIAGGEMPVEFTFERFRSCPWTWQSFMTDSNGTTFSITNLTLPEEFRRRTLSTISYSFSVPQDAAPGAAKYYFVAEFECNPVQNIWPVQLMSPAIKFHIGPQKR